MRTSGLLRDSWFAALLSARRLMTGGFAPAVVLLGLAGVAIAGCNSSFTKSDSGGSSSVENYLAGGVGNLETYAVDHTANTFVVNSYSFGGGAATGGTVQISGNITPRLANGIYDLNPTYFQGEDLGTPPLTGNWLVEIPGQAALTELEGTNSSGTSTSFAPLAPTNSCPNFSSSVAFQFVTIPKRLSTKSTLVANAWNPQIETAYGSAAVSTSGSSVQFSSISQFTLPSANGGSPGAPMTPAPSSATAACSSTFFGQTVSYPPSGTVNNPGSSGNQANPAVATIAISSSGFLVEDSGAPSGATSSLPPYENLLGAGYGAIGLPKPSGALSTSDVVAAQYQGILYGAASGSSAAVTSPGFRLIGSFGYSSLQTSCPAPPVPPTSTIIYGGEFANNDPSANAAGNCDLAIDLGAQDASNNGLYTGATVYVAAGFPYNVTGAAYSFPAVAIAGKINGKYGIFLIGADTNGTPAQPWGIYLLQSN